MIPLSLFPVISAALLITGVSAIGNSSYVSTFLKHNRAQVFISASYGSSTPRHKMGVLINSMFIVTTRGIFFEQCKGQIVRIYSLNSFHGGQRKTIEDCFVINSESPVNDERFDHFLLRLATPFEGMDFSGLAFMQSNLYGVTEEMEKFQMNGFHGARPEKNVLAHGMQFLMIRTIDPWNHCCVVFTDLMKHFKLKPHEVMMNCMIDARSPNTDEDWYTRRGGLYDDGGGVFWLHSNHLNALVMTTLVVRAPWWINHSSAVAQCMGFQRNLVRKLRAENKDFYAAFPEGAFAKRRICLSRGNKF